ncbi:MAG: AAA family ATPase [Candidatus Parvarchaeum sp.]
MEEEIGQERMKALASYRAPLDFEIEEEALLPKEKLKVVDNDYFPVLFVAPAGYAKTTSLIKFGLDKGYKVFVQECASDMMVSDLIGSWSIDDNGKTIFLAGEVPSALKLSADLEKEFIAKYGELTEAEYEAKLKDFPKVLLILDEVNLLSPVVTKGIGSLFDSRKYVNTPIGRIYGVNRFLRVAGTMNSENNSAGYMIDPATRSRFFPFYIKPAEVVENLLRLKIIKDDMGKLMSQTNGLFSIREIEQVTLLSREFGYDIPTALGYVLAKFDDGERKVIIDTLAALQIEVKEVW